MKKDIKNKTQIVSLLFIIFYAQLVNTVTQNSLAEVKVEVETYLSYLKTQASNLYDQRCFSSCTTKTYNECTDVAPTLTCHSEYAKPDGCQYTGANLSYNYAAGRCSNDVPCNTSEDREIICGVSELFEENDLQFDQNSIIRYAYVGFHNSYRITYPYSHVSYDDNNQCREYDPRYRPWYVAGSTGAKNVVIIYDKSGSLSQGTTRYIQAEKAVTAVLNTLGETDYFQIIKFSSQDKSVDTEQDSNILIKATQQNIQQSIRNLGQTSYEGNTNYEIGFKKAFDVFDETNNDEIGNRGEKIILFLTDGDITEGKGQVGVGNGIQDIIDYIDFLILDTGINVSIFTYALGDTATVTVPKRIACRNSGIFEQIFDSDDEEDIVKAMRGYYTFLSSAVTIEQPIWSQVYEDYNTGLEFVTVSLPIYESFDNVQRVVGVAAVDLLHSDLQKFQDYEQLEVYQGEARSNFSDSTLNECDIEKMRNNKCDGDVDMNYTLPVGCTVTSSSADYTTCPPNTFTSSAFQLIGNTQTNLSICCKIPDPDYIPDQPDNKKSATQVIKDEISEGLSGGAIAGIIIGIIAFLVIVGGVFVCVKNSKAKKGKQLREQQLREEHQKQEEEDRKQQQQLKDQENLRILRQQEEQIRQQNQMQMQNQNQNQMPQFQQNPVQYGNMQQPQQPLAPMGFDINGQQIGNPMNPMDNIPQQQGFGQQQQQQGYNYPEN